MVLGKTGRNLAAGMSGGIAYVYDVEENFKDKCNMGMVEFEVLSDEDKTTIHNLLSNHKKYTNSSVAGKVLDSFNKEIKRFVKVMPIEYKRILQQQEVEEKLGLAESSDG